MNESHQHVKISNHEQGTKKSSTDGLGAKLRMTKKTVKDDLSQFDHRALILSCRASCSRIHIVSCKTHFAN